ncbi:hypothetical protein, partial [Burkholderia sp. Tr-20355]|uniref:hypothetical protein n=1 Tax=Burkholderia sp. Tr-20355 TaxID=2703895 RepID=UPI00197F64D6
MNNAEGGRIVVPSRMQPGATTRRPGQFAAGALAPDGADDATGLAVAGAGDALDGADADAGADAADAGAGAGAGAGT